MTVVGGNARKQDSAVAGSVLVHPMAVAYRSPCASAAVRVRPGVRHGPLSTMAFAKSPLLLGASVCRQTLLPPADSPKSVTLVLSPPKFAMFVWTHFRAACWSSKP